MRKGARQPLRSARRAHPPTCWSFAAAPACRRTVIIGRPDAWHQKRRSFTLITPRSSLSCFAISATAGASSPGTLFKSNPPVVFKSGMVARMIKTAMHVAQIGSARCQP